MDNDKQRFLGLYDILLLYILYYIFRPWDVFLRFVRNFLTVSGLNLKMGHKVVYPVVGNDDETSSSSSILSLLTMKMHIVDHANGG